MPVEKLECPECGAVLKPSKPVAPGKKVKCPKCGEVFTAGGDEDEAPRPAKKPAAKPAKAAPVAKKPAAPPPKRADDDDEGGGIYGFIQEPGAERRHDDEEDEDEDDDKKPDLTFALDESIRDPRGPAQVKVVRPSNFLMIAGVLQVVVCVAVALWSFWPLVFSQEWVDPHEVVKTTQKLKEDEAPPPLERKELKPGELEDLERRETAFFWIHIIIIVACVPFLILGSLVVVGGVKMQQLESYPWAMTACILAIIFGGLIGLLCGIFALMCLLDPVVKEGFQYEKEHRHDV